MTTYDEFPPADNPGLLPYRVRQLESFRRDVDTWRRDVDNDRTEQKFMRQDVNSLTEAVEDLKRTIIRASVSLAGSAVIVLVSTLIATGHGP